MSLDKFLGITPKKKEENKGVCGVARNLIKKSQIKWLGERNANRK